jgi:hypothetical protein
LKSGIKVYYFSKSSFIKVKNSLCITSNDKIIRIVNKSVRGVFKRHVIGKKLSFPDLYLIVELNLSSIKDKEYCWKLIRLIELAGSDSKKSDRLYYFHPERYEMVEGQLKLGNQECWMTIKDQETIEYFDRLKGKIFFGKELLKAACNKRNQSSQIKDNLMIFLKEFYKQNTFGHNFIL